MEALASRFVEESSLELHSFLNNPLAEALEGRLRDLDTRDGLGEERPLCIPPHSAGTTAGWTLKGPPHKWRYCILKTHPENGKKSEAVLPRAHASSIDEILRSLQNELFSSSAFRNWLAIVTRLMPMKYAAEARRFRPGLDYTLATSDKNEARLDVVLGLTPPTRDLRNSSDDDDESPQEKDKNKKQRGSDREGNRGWTTGEWGGWECYMAPHNEEDDPAIYRSSTHKKSKAEKRPVTNGYSGSSESSTKANRSSSSRSPSRSSSLGCCQGHEDRDVGAASETASEAAEEEEEDSTLLSVMPGYNRLLLVLRDERVMRFVKYVSAAAEGSRWDVCGEYEVGMLEEQNINE